MFSHRSQSPVWSSQQHEDRKLPVFHRENQSSDGIFFVQFVLAAVLALAVALPVKRDALEKKIIQIVRSSSETNEDGSYSNS